MKEKFFNPSENMWNAARLALAAAWLAALGLMFYTTFLLTIGAFTTPQNDLTHGWLVPPVALAMACWRWRALRASAGRPAWGGVLLMLLVFALLWLGTRGGQSRFSQVALCLAIPAFAWAGWGRNTARLLAYPSAFMLFILPLNFLDFITLPLRLLSSYLATGLLNGFSVGVVRQGSALLSTTGKFSLDVADPCSGIKSIFAILALSAAYAFFTQKTALRALLLIAVGVPLAVLTNIVRLVTIGVVAELFGQARAMDVFHNMSGFITFPIAILVLIPLGEKVIPKIGRVPPPAPPAPPARQLPWPAGVAFLLAAAVATAGVHASLKRMPETQYGADNFLPMELPAMLGNLKGQPIWYCHAEKCEEMFPESAVASTRKNEDEDAAEMEAALFCLACGDPLHPASLSETQILPDDTRFMKCQYGEGEGSWNVTVVVSGRSRQSIHRPELCLPGQGYVIDSKTPRTLVLDNGRRLEVMLFKVSKAGVGSIAFVNFLVSERVQTSSHFTRITHDILQRSIHGRVNRWAMFTLVGSKPVDSPGELENLRVMLSTWWPQVYLPDSPGARE